MGKNQEKLTRAASWGPPLPTWPLTPWLGGREHTPTGAVHLWIPRAPHSAAPAEGRVKSSPGCLPCVRAPKGKQLWNLPAASFDIWSTPHCENRETSELPPGSLRRAGRACRLEALRGGGFCLQRAFLSSGPSGRPRQVLSALGLWTRAQRSRRPEPGLLICACSPHLLTPFSPLSPRPTTLLSPSGQCPAPQGAEDRSPQEGTERDCPVPGRAGGCVAARLAGWSLRVARGPCHPHSLF